MFHQVDEGRFDFFGPGVGWIQQAQGLTGRSPDAWLGGNVFDHPEQGFDRRWGAEHAQQGGRILALRLRQLLVVNHLGQACAGHQLDGPPAAGGRIGRCHGGQLPDGVLPLAVHGNRELPHPFVGPLFFEAGAFFFRIQISDGPQTIGEFLGNQASPFIGFETIVAGITKGEDKAPHAFFLYAGTPLQIL